MSNIYPISGIKIGTACAGIKQTERDDLVLFALNKHATCAAVFTRNAFSAAPVVLAKHHLSVQAPCYLLINSGNANAGTGKAGLQDALACCQSVAQLMDCLPTQVLPFSTGVIGQNLPVTKIQTALPTAQQNSGSTAEHWQAAARAIMTTDTKPKILSKQIDIGGHLVHITGIAKGAGMIRPDMATLLAYIATDAKVTTTVLKMCLMQAVEQSFNRISIDGDTSTNDACVLIASGESSLPLIDSTTHRGYALFTQAVQQVCVELAQAVVRDGEGATKFINIEVVQGEDEQECEQVAYAIANSPLVKTAFYASDANWGRILAAVGRAGVHDFQIDKVKIYLDKVCIVENGAVANSYTEEQGQAVMAQDDICIRVELGRGTTKTNVWTCDLSLDYVKINAEYRT